jgi:hypothetical protein
MDKATSLIILVLGLFSAGFFLTIGWVLRGSSLPSHGDEHQANVPWPVKTKRTLNGRHVPKSLNEEQLAAKERAAYAAKGIAMTDQERADREG